MNATKNSKLCSYKIALNNESINSDRLSIINRQNPYSKPYVISREKV